MARDPLLPLTDVQWVLGHAQLSTTQLYLTPMPADVIAGVLAHHRRAESATAAPPGRTSDGVGAGGLSGGYRPDSLQVLFGKGVS